MTVEEDGTIETRELGADGIELLREIDRSEHIDTRYTVEDGRMVGARVEWEVPPWNAEGDGDHSFGRLISEFRPVVEGGAILLGAFIDNQFAGIAIVDASFEGDTAWFAFLHVSRDYRRRGIASALWASGEEIAVTAGATSIYVSATSSGSDVGFYTTRGCQLADPPHAALFAKEPEDIHFVCPLT
ncbi:MAG: GNAT family N-acetyltransferase [Acidimicrobiia bacterium]|nr:GNAT family N-acetyltransferase [Acidimicrobiia bacterium]